MRAQSNKPLILGRLMPSKPFTCTQVLSQFAALHGGMLQPINFSNSDFIYLDILPPCKGVIPNPKMVFISSILCIFPQIVMEKVASQKPNKISPSPNMPDQAAQLNLILQWKT